MVDLELTFHFLPIAGRMECVGVDVRSFTGPVEHPRRLAGSEPRSVTTSDLRSLRFAQLIDEARRDLGRFQFAELGDPDWDEAPWASGQDEEPKRGRPPAYGPDHFVEVAHVYREAFARGRAPTRAVAQQFHVSESTAAKWVARCRRPELGLLPPTTRGRARAVEESDRKGKAR
jgi:hypothetical protein